jgi:hypothetical protein
MTYAQGGAGTAQSQWGSVVNYEYYEIPQECAAEKPGERAAAKPCERDQMLAEKLREMRTNPNVREYVRFACPFLSICFT